MSDFACDAAFKPGTLGRIARLRRYPGARGSRVTT
jgi:hypothetical protein